MIDTNTSGLRLPHETPATGFRCPSSASRRHFGWKLMRRGCRADILTSMPRPSLTGSCRKLPTHTSWHPLDKRWEARAATGVRQAATAAVSGQISGSAFATWWPALALICSTLILVAAAIVSIVVFLRPLIKRLERLAIAAERAVRGFEKASLEFEQASQVMSGDLPTALEAVERASLEFEELGQSLNGLTGGRRKGKQAPHRTLTKHTRAAENPLEAVQSSTLSSLEAVQSSTRNSMARVAKDVAALTAALTPAMDAWRKRISFITERFEAASKEQASAEKPPVLPSTATASTSNGGSSPDIKEAATNWITEWRQQAMASKAPPSKEETGRVVTNLAIAATDAAQVARESHFKVEPTGILQEGDDLMEEAAKVGEILNRGIQLDGTAKAPSASSPSPPVTKAEGSFSPGSNDSSTASTRDEGEQDKASTFGQEQARIKLQERKTAADAVFLALSRAEDAASAAAAASGELESALQRAEAEAGMAWWGFEEPTSSSGVEAPQMDDGMAFPSSPFLASRSEEGQQEASADKATESGTKEEGWSNLQGNGGAANDESTKAQDGPTDGVGKVEGPGMLAGLWGAKSRSGYRD